MTEFEDAPAVLAEKLDRLARLVLDSGNTAVFTGAGLSTAADIPDFRGDDGLDAKPRPLVCIGAAEKDLDFVMPTYAHVAVARLLEAGVFASVATSNHDGLHQRSGVPAGAIADVFGNVYVEQCVRCGAQYQRSVVVPALGRKCGQCQGRLLKTGTRMGAATPAEPLRRATEFAQAADLGLVLGSSMTVTPFCELPGLCKRFVLVTLQRTAYDDRAALCIHARCDAVLRGLLERLGCAAIMAEPFVYRARMRLVHTGDEVRLEGATEEEPPTWAAAVAVDGQELEKGRAGLFALALAHRAPCTARVEFVESSGCDPLEVALAPGEAVRVEAPRVVVF